MHILVAAIHADYMRVIDDNLRSRSEMQPQKGVRVADDNLYQSTA